MCTLSNSKSRLKTGYKVLAIKDGKYYSSFTGQEMKIGIVKRAPRECKRLSAYWTPDIVYGIKRCSFYNKKFNGKTGAFTSLADCCYFYSHMINITNESDYKLIIVKVVFDGIVIKGDYYNTPIIAGNNIKSITKVRRTIEIED
jgi:hypothetical protein